MKKFYSVLVVACVAAVSFGQGKQDAFDLHVASLRILQRRDVQADMNVTVAQRAKMDKFAEAYDTELNAYLAALKKDGKEDEQLPDQTMYMMLAKLKQNVMAVLDAGQLKRLREISLQVYGLNGLLDETIGQKIGLSQDQMTKIRKRYEQGSKSANDMMANAMKPINKQYKNANPKTDAEKSQMKQAYMDKSKVAMDSVLPQVQKTREDTQSDILAIVTTPQKQAYLALQGRKFQPRPELGDAGPGGNLNQAQKTTKKSKPATKKIKH